MSPGKPSVVVPKAKESIMATQHVLINILDKVDTQIRFKALDKVIKPSSTVLSLSQMQKIVFQKALVRADLKADDYQIIQERWLPEYTATPFKKYQDMEEISKARKI